MLLNMGGAQEGSDGVLDLAAQQPEGAASQITGVGLGDVDGDGDLDAFVAVSSTLTPTRLLINQGAAQGGVAGDFRIAAEQPEGAGLVSPDVVLGDIDGDGDLDAFMFGGGANLLLINQGGVQGGVAGDFDLAADQPDGGSYFSAAAALGDLDGDGDLDVIITNGNSSDPNTQVLINQGGTQGGVAGDLNLATLQPTDDNRSSSDVALGDLDGDGDLDAFVGNINGANRILINQGGAQGGNAGTFVDAINQPEGGTAATSAVALGDLDGDGDLDAFIGNGGSGDQVLINQGGAQGGVEGDFDLAAERPEGGMTSTRDVALGDFDGDGYLDAFIVNFDAADQLLFNQGGAQGGVSGDMDLAAVQPEDDGFAESLGIAIGDLHADGASPSVDADGFPNINVNHLLPDWPASEMDI